MLQVGIVVVLLTTQVVLSVLFGIFFLKEKENKVKNYPPGVGFPCRGVNQIIVIKSVPYGQLM